MSSISQEIFMQFADLALAAFNAKNEVIQKQSDELVTAKLALAEALANDKADADKILEAEAAAEAAKATATDLTAQVDKQNQELQDAINALQVQLGITVPEVPATGE